MRFNATFDHVIVETEKKDEMAVSSGGIYMPTVEKTDIEFGTVVAHGEGTDKYRNRNGEKLELGIKVGDRVGFKKIQATDIEIFNKKYKLMEFGAIVGVFNSSNEVDETSSLIKEE